MNPKPDFETDSPAQPLADRLDEMLLNIARGVVPIDGDGGLRAAARHAMTQANQRAAAVFEKSDQRKKLRKIESRIEATNQDRLSTLVRRETAEASLSRALENDDEPDIVLARSMFSAASGDLAALVRELQILQSLKVEALRNCAAAQRSASTNTKAELVGELRDRHSSARRKILAALQSKSVSDAIAEFAVTVHLLSMDEFARDSTLTTMTELAHARPRPEDQQIVLPAATEVSSSAMPAGPRLVSINSIPAG